MQLSPSEALALIRSVAAQYAAAAAAAEEIRAVRDVLVRELDGQEGMSRTAMAEAAGITRMGLWKLVDRGHESEEHNLLMSDALRQALEEAVAIEPVLTPEGHVHFDVHA